MSSYKRLKSVAHSFSHHSMSALSWVHPHLAQACEQAEISEVKINLAGEPVLPEEINASEPLTLSVAGLKDRFKKMLNHEGFSISDLKEANVEFRFNVEKWDYYTSECSTTIITLENRVIKKGLNVRGKLVNA